MKIKYSSALIIGVFLMCGITNVAADTTNALPAFEQKLIAHQKELVEMAERNGVLKSIKMLMPLFSNGQLEHKRFGMLNDLFYIGRGAPTCDGYNGFIREPFIVELLIYALSDDSLHKDAFEWLTYYTEWRLLLPFKTELLEATARLHISYTARIICLLNPTESEKKQWLETGKNLTLAQRAALGDAMSEDSLITLFKKAKTYGELSRMAEDLAFVGSKKCRFALVKGLETDIVNEYPAGGMTVSGICDVIKALRRLHPDEPLLTGEIMRLEDREPVYTNTGIIDDPEFQDYLTRLAKWAKSNYNVKLKLPKKSSFLRRYKLDGTLVVPLHIFFAPEALEYEMLNGKR